MPPPHPPYPIRTFDSTASLAEVLGRELRALLTAAHARPAALALAGGRTPLAAYAAMARLPAAAVSPDIRVLLTDERHVPADDPRSNARSVWPAFASLGVPRRQALLVDGALPLNLAAEAFDRELASLLAAGSRFPLGLLGLGADGHTAALFSAAHVDAGRGRWAQAVARPDGLMGISVTADFLAQFERIRFVVTGAEKRAVLQRLCDRPLSLAAGQAVAGCRAVEIWADGDAAGRR